MDKKILISNTSVNTFYNQKKEYKQKYIDKVPPPNKSSKNFSFGNSIHNSLKEFNLMNPEKQTLNVLERILNKNWITEGYSSTEEMLSNFVRAKEIISNYLENRKDFGKTLISEDMVYYKVNSSLTVCGKIDRVFINNEGKIELVDYKTGKIPNLFIDINTDVQLPIYIILLKYKFNIVPDIISYYYLTNNSKISLEVTSDVINVCLDRLKSIISDMCVLHQI